MFFLGVRCSLQLITFYDLYHVLMLGCYSILLKRCWCNCIKRTKESSLCKKGGTISRIPIACYVTLV